MRIEVAAAALVVGLAFGTGALAADDAAAPPAARALYNQATRAMDDKDFAAACPKLEEVVRLVPEGVGARITLGECYEGLGKLASAWSAFNEAAALATKIGQTSRADKARGAAGALRPRLATVSVDVAPELRALAGLSVERDGAPVGAGSFGVAIPVDKGPHKVTASAPGRRAFERAADAAADGAEVKVLVDHLAPVAGPSTETPALPGPRAGSEPAPAAATSPFVYAGFITAGVGVGVGAIAGAVTLAKASVCKTAPGCSSSSLDGAQATAWISDIAFGVGVAGAAVGVVALVTSKKSASPGAAAEVRLGPRALSIAGTF